MCGVKLNGRDSYHDAPQTTCHPGCRTCSIMARSTAPWRWRLDGTRMVQEEIGLGRYACLCYAACGLTAAFIIEDNVAVPHVLVSFSGWESVVDGALRTTGCRGALAAAGRSIPPRHIYPCCRAPVPHLEVAQRSPLMWHQGS